MSIRGPKQLLRPEQRLVGTMLTEMTRRSFRHTGLYNESMKDLEIEDQLWMSFQRQGEVTGVVFLSGYAFLA